MSRTRYLEITEEATAASEQAAREAGAVPGDSTDENQLCRLGTRAQEGEGRNSRKPATAVEERKAADNGASTQKSKSKSRRARAQQLMEKKRNI